MPNYESFKLFRIAGEAAVRIGAQDQDSSKPYAYLAPFRMLSVSGFKFPFSSSARIREAIKLQTLSYSGGNSIQIFPVSVAKSSKEASGFSFFVPDSELAELEEITGDVFPIFPAPLSLASSVSGNGITVWTDEKNICSVIWSSGIPELYRWCANKKSALDSEIDWLKKYCESKGTEEKNNIFIFNAENDSEQLQSILGRSLESFPWLREVNLSRGAINSVMIIEKFVRYASKAALWIAVFGSIFAVGALLNHSAISKSLESVRSSSENLYREVFGQEGRIVDPVNQARGKINALKGSGASGKILSDVLADLGTSLQTKSMDITIDSMRYNAEGTDLVGAASDMAAIQSFRTAFADMGGDAQLGEVQQIPGGGFRFNLGIRWE